MICQTCNSNVPNSECSPTVNGRTASVVGPCPKCGYKFLGRVRLTDDQFNAWHHDINYNHWPLIRYINTRLWIPETAL